MAKHRLEDQQACDFVTAELVAVIERKGVWGEVTKGMTADQKRDIKAALDRNSKRK